jgi:hypothetical protein
MKLNLLVAIAIGVLALQDGDSSTRPTPANGPESNSLVLPSIDSFRPNVNGLIDPQTALSPASGAQRLRITALSDGTYIAGWAAPDQESRTPTGQSGQTSHHRR